MTDQKSRLTPEEQAKSKKARKEYERLMKKNPTMSREEFLRQTEVSDEQYGLGISLPGSSAAK